MRNTILCVALLLALTLGACAPEDAPAAGTAPPLSDAPASQLAGLLAGLCADSIGCVSWYSPNEPPAPEQIAALLSNASGHVIAHDGPTVDDTARSVLWSLDVYIAPAGQSVYSGDDALSLQTGLEENVVQVLAGANLPAGPICLEDPALYQLLRTSCDTPDNIVTQAYSACKAVTDAYYDARLALCADCDFSGWELTRFREAGTSQTLGARAYAISAAFLTDFSQRAVPFRAGGMYVDSALRAHGLDWQLTYLVTLDGTPAGVLRLSPDELPAGECPLAAFETRQALSDALWTPGEEL